MQEHTEALCTSLCGTADYIAALLRTARAAALGRRLNAAEASLRAAAALLPRARCAPPLHAAVWLELARALRRAAALGLPHSDAAASAGSAAAVAARIRGDDPLAPAGGAQSSQQQPSQQLSGRALEVARLSEAQECLCKAVGILALDGGCQNALIRECLLEMAACLLTAGAPVRAAAALGLAHAAGSKHSHLQLSSAQHAPAAAAGLPRWLVDQMRGQEAAAAGQDALSSLQPAAASSQPGAKGAADALATAAAPGAIVAAEPLICRLALSHCAWLQSARAGLAGRRDAARCEAQLLALHAPLRAACPKLGTEYCWAKVPLPPLDAQEPAAGDGLIPPAGDGI